MFDYKYLKTDYVSLTYKEGELDEDEKEIVDLETRIKNSAEYKNYNNFNLAANDQANKLSLMKSVIEEEANTYNDWMQTVSDYGLDVNFWSQYSQENINKLYTDYNKEVGKYNQINAGLKENINILGAKYTLLDEKIKNYNDKVGEVSSLEDIKRHLGALQRNYSWWDKTIGEVGSGEPGTFGIGMSKAMYDSAVFFEDAWQTVTGAENTYLNQDPSSSNFGERYSPHEIIKNAKKEGVSLEEYTEKNKLENISPWEQAAQSIRTYEDSRSKKFYKPITFDKAFDSVGNMFEFLGDQAINQVPFFAAMSINPYLVIPIGGGGYISDRQKRI